MGLDIVEYVIALEGAFGIEIPDADAVGLETPRLLIDYLASRLPVATESPGVPYCLTQRAFYRTRTAAARRFAVPPKSLRPATDLRELMGERISEWGEFRLDLGAREWPRLQSENWWSSYRGGVTTLGQLAGHLALYDTALVRPPGSPWTRTEIEALVLQLLEGETGVDISKYTLDSRFVRDMGLD
jgi:acyl carrier protein